MIQPFPQFANRTRKRRFCAGHRTWDRPAALCTFGTAGLILSAGMDDGIESLATLLLDLEKEAEGLRAANGSQCVGPAIERSQSDIRALRFHLHKDSGHRPMVCVLGGTGTGKSTIVNRLLETEVSGTSFRRTFTSGAVAIHGGASVPAGWLGLAARRIAPQDLPARGEAGTLVVVRHDHPVTAAITIVDTPDLDGDQPVHHAEADRVFRWAEAIVFVVTPEKYQMTELLPYYRLALRYALPSLFVMNKCEEAAVVEDYRRQLSDRGYPQACLYVVARDDAAYEPPPDASLASLREATAGLGQAFRSEQSGALRAAALRTRCRDMLERLRDQVTAPLAHRHEEIHRLMAGLRAMAVPAPGVDLAPATSQLQRRMQEQSVLFLMGPQRLLQRVRQVPGLLLRLPRTAWDVLMGGHATRIEPPLSNTEAGPLPDFAGILTDQFRILQSRMDDLLGDGMMLRTEADGEDYRRTKFDPAEAGRIATQELDDLNAWLTQRWDQSPRDTMLFRKLLKALPGGRKLTEYSEAAPYLLAVIMALHHATFWGMDLLVIGSFGMVVWLVEKLSNEVTSRTRKANERIAERFAELAARQVEATCAWLSQQTVRAERLERVERLMDRVAQAI